tara:strand:- start:8 stop:388 length:381 start_codon:yes stop_codon:yes gene_type:complete
MKAMDFVKGSGFSDKFLALRRSSGMTQQELADVLEVQKGVISRIERKAQNPSEELLKKVVEHFEGISLEWLTEAPVPVGKPPQPKADSLQVENRMLKEKIEDQKKIIRLLEDSLDIAKKALNQYSN